ncbi:MAG: PQQ-dependent sugar dehydrogenase, partial [Pirellulaceae bacterium]
MSRLLKSAISFLLLIGFAATLSAQPPKKPAEPGPPIPNDPVLDVNLKKTFLNLRIRRPICLTNAGDGSNRMFIAEQQGVIHVLPNDPEVEETKVFLDIEGEVHFNPRQNEEGFLGLAFHPDYKNKGHFYVYYTTRREPNLSVISRFTVSKDDPDKADPESEVVLMTIPQPYWNHNGGSIEFGPDGYLYIGLGDGGSANDPHGNGQKLSTLLGSVLRIDVDKQDSGKNYAIPADNPFTESPLTRPEIYAYGIRNIWRLTFDRKTGDLWAADVGQDLWEEINIVTKGGNYGWNKREGNHSFP